jgi:hypothetical protein
VNILSTCAVPSVGHVVDIEITVWDLMDLNFTNRKYVCRNLIPVFLALLFPSARDIGTRSMPLLSTDINTNPATLPVLQKRF